MTDEKKRKLLRLCWKAGYEIRDHEEFVQLRRKVELAFLEGWNAEGPDEIDYSYAGA